MARVLHGARVLYILRIVRRVLGNVRELDAFHVTVLSPETSYIPTAPQGACFTLYP